MNWSEIFEYNDGKLFWKVSFGSRALVGSEAGYDSLIGYRVVGFQKRKFYCHRIIWEMLVGTIPDKILVDHINGDKKDNRICNLRLATPSQDKCNVSKPKRTIGRTSEFLGVCWAAKKKKWKSEITLNGKNKFLGHFDSELKASDAYLQAKLKLHKEFSGLSLPHQLLAEEK